ncbi:hypothetical protein [Mameliella alba]|uniref:Phage protein n=1 Tax=Mameliella alba TaxID=561184 RepID=A0A0B3RWI5_9RHOB|nr:hypothetical protein [Mameliella alba]KHQ51108.1 hypothetical protein OA50_04479 [Mameliella alba]
MPIFRKKPVEIEARRLCDPRKSEADWKVCRDAAVWSGARWVDDAVDSFCLIIPTPEGDMKALPGDWIIKGVKGEFYPCKNDIFERTYEPVPAPSGCNEV